MENVSEKMKEVARECTTITKKYKHVVLECMQSVEPMPASGFFPLVEQLCSNIQERMNYQGIDSVSSGVHNLYCKFAEGDFNTDAWLSFASFIKAYQRTKGTLSNRCFNMPGVGKGDDGYGDWIDSLPLSGKPIVEGILTKKLASYLDVEKAVEADHPKMKTFIMDGENYVEMRLEEKLIDCFQYAVSTEDAIKEGK